MNRILDRGSDWIDQKRPMEPVGLFRIVVGAMVLVHVAAFFRARESEFYRDSFYLPYWDWLPEPSSFQYSLLLWGIVGCGIAIILGLRSRIVFPATFVLMAYHLFPNKVRPRRSVTAFSPESQSPGLCAGLPMGTSGNVAGFRSALAHRKNRRRVKG